VKKEKDYTGKSPVQDTTKIKKQGKNGKTVVSVSGRHSVTKCGYHEHLVCYGDNEPNTITDWQEQASTAQRYEVPDDDNNFN
jgi:hypothetical protein